MDPLVAAFVFTEISAMGEFLDVAELICTDLPEEHRDRVGYAVARWEQAALDPAEVQRWAWAQVLYQAATAHARVETAGLLAAFIDRLQAEGLDLHPWDIDFLERHSDELASRHDSTDMDAAVGGSDEIIDRDALDALELSEEITEALDVFGAGFGELLLPVDLADAIADMEARGYATSKLAPEEGSFIRVTLTSTGRRVAQALATHTGASK